MIAVSAVAEKERLVEQIVRLRRAERRAPDDTDIVAVRRDLERAVGPTVRRSVAARALGVSQPTLDRWISEGDIPAVLTPTGRREVPLRALVGLIEAMEDGEEIEDQRHPLASVLRGRRRDAERLGARDILASEGRGPEYGHREAELRGLAYHRAVAQRLDERIIRDARDRLARWRAEGKIDPRYAQRWEEVLSWPPARIAKLIRSDSEDARALRQSSPLAGTLTEPERRRLLELVGSKRP